VTLDAGEVDIAETPDLLVDALHLGDALIVYKERSMYAVRYVGYPAIFAVQRLPGDSGMLFRGCGAMTPLGHVVLTAGDVVLNTGQVCSPLPMGSFASSSSAISTRPTTSARLSLQTHSAMRFWLLS